MTKHQTVMKDETIENLNLKNGDTLLDLTFGGGGHSLKALEIAKVKIFAFDMDKSAEANFQKDFPKESKQITFVHDNFANLKSKIVTDIGQSSVDGIVADLGWSSDQLESLAGLSYQNRNDPLDMRFGADMHVQAKDILNTSGKNELSDIFARFADMNGVENEKLITEIRNFRSKKLFERVADLVEVIDRAFGLKKIESKSRKHGLYGRVFQALRIKVNSEYENLSRMLVDGFSILNSSKRMSIITFHSGEDKIMDQFLNQIQRNNSGKIISNSVEGKFFRPSVDELTQNLRARSAKLYVIEKL